MKLLIMTLSTTALLLGVALLFARAISIITFFNYDEWSSADFIVVTMASTTLYAVVSKWFSKKPEASD